MILAVAATQMEIDALWRCLAPETSDMDFLICGVGPIEAAVRMGRYLSKQHQKIKLVVHFGVAGAYFNARKIQLLDICLAESEVLGDFGICYADRIEYFTSDIASSQQFSLDGLWLKRVEQYLIKNHKYHRGTFITVCGTSGTRARGEVLAATWDGLCENMEGAALARVLTDYQIPLVELRVISNFVTDRDLSSWRLREAVEKSGEVTAQIIKEFLSHA